MKDYEYLFAMNLHARLKEMIEGKVFVKVKGNDKLYVKIESFGDLRYEVELPDFSEKVMNGLTSEYIVYEIVKRYKCFILERYFK